MTEPFILARTNYKTLKNSETCLAVLPWGATEAHNYHLPYATDNILAEKIAEESARYAWIRGAKVLVLPGIPFGVNTGQADIRICINMNPGTQLAVLADITDTLNRHGIARLMILNGHGGNDFRQIIRELGLRFPSMFICVCNWYQAVDTGIFENSGGHADEMETSMMMHIAPDLLLPLDEAGEGKAKKFRVSELNGPWAWAERKWSAVTKDTGVGNPYRATPEKGRKCFNQVIDKIGNFMIDLCRTDINDMYT